MVDKLITDNETTQSVILGTSNCARLQIDDPNVVYWSALGTIYDQVYFLLDKSGEIVDHNNK
jgi:hypothetical protein